MNHAVPGTINQDMVLIGIRIGIPLFTADIGAQRSTNAHLLFFILVSLQKTGLRMLDWSLLLLLLLLLVMLLLGAVALAVPVAFAAAVAVAVTHTFRKLGSDAFDVFAV